MTPVVLVEGESDAHVVRMLAGRRGLDCEVVAMGGITNVRRYAARLLATDPATVLLGLGDARERRYLEKVEPPLAGVFLCERDLEDELYRALGTEEVLAAIEAIGDGDRFQTFVEQPEWRGRPLLDQLLRFASTRGGRKAILAAELARRLDDRSTPAPLRALLDTVASYDA